MINSPHHQSVGNTLALIVAVFLIGCVVGGVELLNREQRGEPFDIWAPAAPATSDDHTHIDTRR